MRGRELLSNPREGLPAAAAHSGSAQAQGRGDAPAWGSDGEEMNDIKISLVKENEIPLTPAEIKKKEHLDLVEVKRLIQDGKPLDGNAIKISFTETLGMRLNYNRAISFAFRVTAFAKRENFPVNATWRKNPKNADHFDVYVYRTEGTGYSGLSFTMK